MYTPGAAELSLRVRSPMSPAAAFLHPVHLLRVFLLRVLESNFPGDSL